VLNARAGQGRWARVATLAELRLLALVVVAVLGLIALSTQVQVPVWVHPIALFVHLAALVVGLGSVLAVDWYGLLFFARRLPMRAVLVQADRMSPLIWLGLVGLVVSGTFLHPELGSSLTVIKLAAVLLISIVGVLTLATKRQMMRQAFALPRGLLLRGMILAAASQSLWWTAVVIGFLNSQG
jgi:hypothetical protein